MKKIQITVELSREEAWALALFAKRTHFGTFRALSVNEEEAYEMRDSLCKVWSVLEKNGIAPR